MLNYVFYSARVDTAAKGDARKAIDLLKRAATRIILSEKKEIDDIIQEEEESDQREEEMEDLILDVENLKEMDDL